MSLRAVTVKRENAWAHLYDEDLTTIIGEFRPGEIGFSLPGMRHHLWHTFAKVLLADKWGWVSLDCLTDPGGD